VNTRVVDTVGARVVDNTRINEKCLLDSKYKDVKLRSAIGITEDNISYCKEPMNMAEASI
jgi:hypothetical protein